MSGSEEKNRSKYESRAVSSKGMGFNNRRCSVISIDKVSECLSECERKREREIEKIKKFMVEKKQEKRRNNIVIKGDR